MESNLRKGIALALLAALISGFSVFINGVAIKLADPVAYTLLKNVGAFALLAAIILECGELRHIRSLSRKQWMTLVLIGVIGGSIPFAMFFYGLKLGGAAVSSFIFRSLFVFAGVFGYLILKEEPEPRDVAAGFAILIGNALLVSGDLQLGLGQLLVLGATMLWALEYTLSRKALSDIAPRTLMASRMLFGSVVLLATMGIGGALGSFALTSIETIQWLLLTSVALGAFMMAWYTSLKYLPILKAASILALGGIVTAVLDAFFLGKAVTPGEAAGLFMILIGVAAIAGLAAFSRTFAPHLQVRGS
jgi:drug/metabolite transporter (DMT)-like permease